MPTAMKEPSKQARREFDRWRRVLKMHDTGLSDVEIGRVLNVTRQQVHQLVNRAQEAKKLDWI